MNWSNGEQGLICVFGAPTEPPPVRTELPGLIRTHLATERSRHVMLMLNPIGQPRDYWLPEFVRAIRWRQFINTAAEPPDDIYPDLNGPPPPLQGPIKLAERSLVCYVASG